MVARSRRSATKLSSKLSSLSKPDRSTRLGPRHSKSFQPVSSCCCGTAGEAACRRGCWACCGLRRLPLASELWLEAVKCGTWTVARVGLTGSPSRRLKLASRARRRASGELALTAAGAAMPCASNPNHGDCIRDFEVGEKGLSDHLPQRSARRFTEKASRGVQTHQLDHSTACVRTGCMGRRRTAYALVLSSSVDRRAAPPTQSQGPAWCGPPVCSWWRVLLLGAASSCCHPPERASGCLRSLSHVGSSSKTPVRASQRQW